MAQEHAEVPILEHVNELIESLEAKGIQATLEEEPDDGDWDGVDADSEDDDGDVEMS